MSMEAWYSYPLQFDSPSESHDDEAWMKQACVNRSCSGSVSHCCMSLEGSLTVRTAVGSIMLHLCSANIWLAIQLAWVRLTAWRLGMYGHALKLQLLLFCWHALCLLRCLFARLAQLWNQSNNLHMLMSLHALLMQMVVRCGCVMLLQAVTCFCESQCKSNCMHIERSSEMPLMPWIHLGVPLPQQMTSRRIRMTEQRCNG
jgi:hypothetical protein